MEKKEPEDHKLFFVNMEAPIVISKKNVNISRN